MDIGISSASFYPDVNTEDTIKLMKTLGFHCGEVFLNSSCEYEGEILSKIIENKEKYKVDINSVHGFSIAYEPFLFDRYRRRKEDMFKYFKKVCAAAKALGAECYTFHGMRTIDYKSANRKHILDVYNELCYIACENGIKLAQENVSWCMSSNVDFISLLRENCKYPIFFTLDIKQAYKAGISPYDYLDVMGDKVANLHINDRDNDNLCLLPGKGDVDYNKLKSYLKHIGYKGHAVIEVYRENFNNYEELSKSKEFLNALL